MRWRTEWRRQLIRGIVIERRRGRHRAAVLCSVTQHVPPQHAKINLHAGEITLHPIHHIEHLRWHGEHMLILIAWYQWHSAPFSKNL